MAKRDTPLFIHTSDIFRIKRPVLARTADVALKVERSRKKKRSEIRSKTAAAGLNRCHA